MKRYLIESADGNERQCVRSMDGYVGWKIIGEPDRDPDDDDDWDLKAKRFKKNKGRAARREKLQKARDPDHLLERIEALEAIIESRGERK